jgi:hypothetical protein
MSAMGLNSASAFFVALIWGLIILRIGRRLIAPPRLLLAILLGALRCGDDDL